MKEITALIILTITSLNIHAQKEQPVTSIVLESFSRGYNASIRISNDSAMSTTNTGSKCILLTTTQWNKLTSTLNSVTLSTIPQLKSPTHQREVDGAMHCRMSISTTNESYESQYFDCGQPMKELKALYDKIEALKIEISSNGKSCAN